MTYTTEFWYSVLEASTLQTHLRIPPSHGCLLLRGPLVSSLHINMESEVKKGLITSSI